MIYGPFYSYNAIVRLKKWFGSMLGHRQVDTRFRSGQIGHNLKLVIQSKIEAYLFQFPILSSLVVSLFLKVVYHSPKNALKKYVCCFSSFSDHLSIKNHGIASKLACAWYELAWAGFYNIFPFFSNLKVVCVLFWIFQKHCFFLKIGEKIKILIIRDSHFVAFVVLRMLFVLFLVRLKTIFLRLFKHWSDVFLKWRVVTSRKRHF